MFQQDNDSKKKGNILIQDKKDWANGVASSFSLLPVKNKNNVKFV